jgi:glycosyltransferase involved in cell wall biosynthesis
MSVPTPQVQTSDRPLDGVRVLMTADTVGGVFTYVLTLASELTRRGAIIHLATMGTGLRPPQRCDAREIPRLVLHESTFKPEWSAHPWDDVARAGEWLLALERDLLPDLIQLNGYCHGAAGFRAPVVVVGHSCLLSWWQAVVGEPAPPSFDRYLVEVSRGLARADALVTPTAAMMRCLERDYGALPARFVIPHGVPSEGARLLPKRDRSVLAAGRIWDRAKNIEALARVAPRLSGRVRVAGCDSLPDGSRRSLPNVEVLGWIDGCTLAKAMEDAAIFAHPARYEPFGLAPVEAALRGCALVLGDIESLREVWGDAAVYVDPDDDDALAAALEGYARDEALRSEHAARALARASMFTPARMADGMAAVYARLLSPGADTAPVDGRHVLSCA